MRHRDECGTKASNVEKYTWNHYVYANSQKSHSLFAQLDEIQVCCVCREPTDVQVGATQKGL